MLSGIEASEAKHNKPQTKSKYIQKKI